MFVDHKYSSAVYKKEADLIKIIKTSPQYRNGKFENGTPKTGPSTKKAASTMWDFFFKGENRTPEKKPPIKKVDLNIFNKDAKKQLSSTWLGHSSLMINIDNYKILIDPVFEKKVSPLGPTRFNGEVPLDINDLPQIDLVIISHNHYDHLNKFSIQRLKQKTSRFFVPLGVGAQLERWGVSRKNIIELDWWDEYKVDNNLTLAATPAQHFSGRGLSDRNKTLWSSWVIKSSNYSIFFSGDSGYFPGFKKIGDKYGPFNITFMECGAYNENWHSVHMFPEETVKAHIDLKGEVLHPIHWGTFNLSLHSWNEPMERLYKAAKLSKIKISTPVAGDTTIYNEYIPTSQWWEQKTDNKEKKEYNKDKKFKEKKK